MKYMLLIYDQEQSFVAMPGDEMDKMYADYMRLNQDLRTQGHYQASSRLQPVASAKTVRVRDGAPVITDGPFAETREQLGGYYLIEAQDMDEALAIAARVPSARRGMVEVRPVMEVAVPAAT